MLNSSFEAFAAAYCSEPSLTEFGGKRVVIE